MIYLYDEAICEDIANSFAKTPDGEPIVRVIDPEGIIQLQAQLKSDVVKFPLISVKRESWGLDSSVMNYTRIHKGQLASFDSDSNNLYYETGIPINIKYTMTVMSESIAEADELLRELVFKYFKTYFLTIRLPYESDRTVRFGVRVDVNATMNRTSSQLEYLQSGRILSTSMALYTEGCMLLHYNERHMVRLDTDMQVGVKDQNGNEYNY